MLAIEHKDNSIWPVGQHYDGEQLTYFHCLSFIIYISINLLPNSIVRNENITISSSNCVRNMILDDIIKIKKEHKKYIKKVMTLWHSYIILDASNTNLNFEIGHNSPLRETIFGPNTLLKMVIFDPF